MRTSHLLASMLLTATIAVADEPPTVGMEAPFEVQLPGSPLEAKDVDKKSPILLRVASTRPHGTLTHYDLRYTGQIPGTFDLRDFLARADGSPLGELPSMPVTISGLLPNPHNGWLIPEDLRGGLWLRGYRWIMIGLVVLWAVIGMRVMRRKPTETTDIEDEAKAEPTLADRIRPLVEEAAAGTLKPDGKARLERMLFNVWKKRLHLEDSDMVSALSIMRDHEEAGGLLRALENWLHRPGGAEAVDVEALLAPYRNLPDEEDAT